ncbi:MAG: hypothetical protein KC535_04325 [Nanoarchaeota archaeon]|nr:hypothetical protein [Nanoarchaeota archaeon]
MVVIPQLTFIYFFHLMGIILMVGSVSVIDIFGFVARKSKQWTYNTIEAHYITKPLIWIGASITTITWIVLLMKIPFTTPALIKTMIIPLLLLNGSFLSFHISPKLSKRRGKRSLLPQSLQKKIGISFLISIVLNWSFVFLTVLSLLS